MTTTAATRWSAPARFLGAAAAWGLALLWLLKTALVERVVLGPLTTLQGAIALAYSGAPAIPMRVTLACSGADVLVLCLAVTLAYPVSWRLRLAGALGGTAVILTLNTARIAVLALAAGTTWFEPLHVMILPAILVLATLAWLSLWMRWSDLNAVHLSSSRVRSALVASTAAVVAYAAALQWLKTSAVLVDLSRHAASATATVLTRMGAQARATDTMLSTPHGMFVVTPECLVTPLMAVYLACAVTLPRHARGRIGALVAAVPVFAVLVLVRLLTVGLPPLVGGRALITTHAFHQILLGVAAIVAGYAWRHGRLDRRSVTVLFQALAVSAALLVTMGELAPAAAIGILGLAGAHPAVPATLLPDGDVQGAMFLLPSFAIALTAGLLIVIRPITSRWRAVTALAATWIGVLLVVPAAALLTWWTGLEVPVMVVRAIAVALPMSAIAVSTFGWRDAAPAGGVTAAADRRERHTTADRKAYQAFWQGVGDHFPDLGGAPSTSFYRDNEVRLLRQALPALAGCRLLKTDLWDEARNTRILQWASSQGAQVVGVDISPPIARDARAGFGGRLAAVVGDVRTLPFADASFDAVYSMGTIEHFDQTELAVCEIARVLKPGGRAIIGVPNRHDPFLRPLLVWALSSMGLYGYGFEKSYSHAALGAMVARADLAVTDRTGILFMPGWLRMVDLACHAWARPLTRVTALTMRPFEWLHRRAPATYQHGYLIVAVARRPAR